MAATTRPPIAAATSPGAPWVRKSQRDAVLGAILSSQATNAARNVAALRPFELDQFGTAPPSPSVAHVEAANELIARLRARLSTVSGALEEGVRAAGDDPTPERLQKVLAQKEAAEQGTKLIEAIWKIYLELFGQRQTPIGKMLLATDRIALDCYRTVYTGLDTTRSVPSPPPFSSMETGATPSTYRRGVKLTKLGKHANPFPLVQLPYHRLVNPWTLGACHHEVAHNLQSDLALWQEVPRRMGLRLQAEGVPSEVAAVWQRWHKEIWADLCAVLLGGPEIVTSLFDVLVRTPAKSQTFNPLGAHPTPYLRAYINTQLLRQLGFPRRADALERAWRKIFPAPARGALPQALLATFAKARRAVVNTVCFEPYRQLGGQRLAQVVRFKPAHEGMIREAARRIAAGNDPGIVPERFLVAAARIAFDEGFAPPERIHRNFYAALVRR